MQPLFSGMLCAEITPLPALLRSLHISPGCVCDCVCERCSLRELCVQAHKHLFIDEETFYSEKQSVQAGWL